MNILLPTKSRESPIGIKMCTWEYWALWSSFLAMCVICACIAVKLLTWQQGLKIKYGNINLVDSDLRFTVKETSKILSLGLIGGFLAGAFGLGGGVIFNPVLLTMGLPPQVSAATGLYLVTYSKIATSLVYFLNGEMNVFFALWIGLWAVVGGVTGAAATWVYMKLSGRQSIIIWMLVAMFVVEVVVIPLVGWTQLAKDIENGVDIGKFTELCP